MGRKKRPTQSEYDLQGTYYPDVKRMSWECILQGMYQNVLWNMIFSGQLWDIKTYVKYGEHWWGMSAAKGWQKIDKSWPKDWQIVGKKHWPNVARRLAQRMSPKHWWTLGQRRPTSAQRRPNVGPTSAMLGQLSNRRRSNVVGPSSRQPLSNSWPDVGPTYWC